MARFDVRSSEEELLDDPGIGAAELHATLGELEVINRALGGYAPSVAGLASLVPADAREITVLDVGTGGGDVARRLADWGASRGVAVRVLGIDVLPAAVEYARAKSVGREDVSFEARDIFALPSSETFDVVHGSLVLHHFEDESAVRLLRTMYALARRGVVVNDLHRHPLAYHWIRLLTRVFSGSRLIRNDAPLSVLRAFRRRDLEGLAARAGLPAPEIRWRWAFRWQVVVRKR